MELTADELDVALDNVKNLKDHENVQVDVRLYRKLIHMAKNSLLGGSK